MFARVCSKALKSQRPLLCRFKSAQCITKFEEIPGPEGYELQIEMAQSDPLTAFDKAYREYDSQVIKFLGPISQTEEVILFDANDIRMVYAKEGKFPHGASSFNNANQEFFEKKRKESGTKYTGAMSKSGTAWREARNVLGPGLMTDAAHAYLDLINTAAIQSVDMVEAYSEQLGTWTKRSAYDMFTSIALGDNPESTDPNSSHELASLVECGDNALSLSVMLSMWPPEMHTPNAYENMVEQYETIFSVTRSYLEKKQNADGFIDLPNCWFKDLREVQGLPMEEIILLMPQFLAAGIGTTEGVIDWNILNLVNNVEKQDILYEELKSELDGSPFRKSANLPYLKACIRESHRLTPPGNAMTMRTQHQDFVTESGFEIPAGTVMWMAPYQVNRDPRYVQNSDKYEPERFLSAAVNVRKKDTTCPYSKQLDHGISKHPFSMGARGCLGRRAAELEIQALMVQLFSRYRVTANPPNQSFKRKQMTLSIPDPMPKVKLTKR